LRCFTVTPIIAYDHKLLGGFLKKIFLIISLFFLSPLAFASEGTFRFGLMPTISMYNVVDPYGPTQTGNAFTYLSGVILADTGRDSRAMANLIYDKFSLSATQTSIAQDVTRTGGGISYQTMFRLSRGFKPWVGFGIGAASESYKNRYTLSPGGFSIPASPSERSINNVFVMLNISNEWQLNKNWDMGLHLQYEQPTGDGTRIVRVGLYIVY
jgi:hypothetical protein